MSNFIEIDSKQLDLAKLLLANVKNGFAKAVSRAINRTLPSVVNQISEGVRNDYTVTAKASKSDFDVEKSTTQTLVGKICSKGNNLPTINFDVNTKKPGRVKAVTVRLVKDNQRKKITGAFVQRGKKSGKINVLMRTSKGHYPLKTIFGLSMPTMMNSTINRKNIEGFAEEKVTKELNSEVNFLLSKVTK